MVARLEVKTPLDLVYLKVPCGQLFTVSFMCQWMIEGLAAARVNSENKFSATDPERPLSLLGRYLIFKNHEAVF